MELTFDDEGASPDLTGAEEDGPAVDDLAEFEDVAFDEPGPLEPTFVDAGTSPDLTGSSPDFTQANKAKVPSTSFRETD